MIIVKNLYKCEKCGKLFESWDNANECEKKHLRLDPYSVEGEFEDKVQYDEGRQLPTRFMIRSEPPRIWNPETCDSEYGIPFYGVYKLERVIPKAEAEELNAARLEKKRREDEEWAAHQARKAAEKAAKEAEAAGESHGTIVLEISEPVAEIIEAALNSESSEEAADAPMNAVEAIAMGAAE